jgi:hypothetical protein
MVGLKRAKCPKVRNPSNMQKVDEHLIWREPYFDCGQGRRRKRSSSSHDVNDGQSMILG